MAQQQARVKGDKVPQGVQRGVVVKFDADRGFGFVRADGVSAATGQDIFVHVRNVAGRRSLHEGQRVRFRITRTEKGLAAIDVQPGSVLTIPYLRFLAFGVASALMLLVGLATALDRPSSMALWLVLWAAAVSMSTFGLYGYDRAQATRGGPRVPEVALHVMGAVGGTPGAFVGMRLFHHKTSKPPFQAVFWLIVAAQAGAIIWWVVSR